jgi:predicted PurR-regulated permease PerM
LQRKGLPTLLALVLVTGTIVGVVLLLALLVGTSLDNFTRVLPGYQERLQEYVTSVLAWLNSLDIEVSVERVRSVFDPGSVMRLANSILSGLGGVLSNAFLILFTVIFILLEASSFSAKLSVVLRDSERRLGHFSELIDGVTRYVGIKSVFSLVTAIAIGIWLAILGVDFVVLWAVLAFFLNYVPNIGSIIAAMPAVLVALIQLGTGTALLTALGYVIVNVVLGNIVEPRVMGRGVGLSPLVVFLSLVFWGWVLGPVGMLLSVPLTMMAKLALEGSEETRRIAILLGSETAAISMSKTSETTGVQKTGGEDTMGR